MSLSCASVCDGIGAVHVAWEPLGWRCAWTAEIKPFPAAVVEHHWAPPNLGDMTRIGRKEIERHGAIDLLVGGTPCQSFSVAGPRMGMDDPRGNLALDYLRIADLARPRWVIWENVPGVLSSSGGRDFGSFLGALGELGYGWAYRVLDAEYVRVDGYGRAVPQRRRRVFVVGCLGDWRCAAAVLFEHESLRGDTPPRRTTGEGTAGGTAHSLRGRSNASHREDSDTYVPERARALNAGGCRRIDGESETFVSEVAPPCSASGPPFSGPGNERNKCEALVAVSGQVVAHALRAEGFDASEDGTGRGTPITSVVAFQESQSGCREYDTAGSLRANGPGHDPVGTRVRSGWAVRRLTPRECERLMGFPDDYTLIEYKGKPAADGPRYRALGNSMCVNVVRWLGRRIELVESIASDKEDA